ncbi:MAG: glucokinase [Candidatus Algichlamydia australiensis]|nr:glucokinase [Chlamydiales bacterium]
MQSMVILAGDIGGTKTHLAVFEGDERIYEKRFPSRDYASLGLIVQEFLSEKKFQPTVASFGIAGPVCAGRCVATNLAWVVDSKEIAQALKVEKVGLLNDLEANAYGIAALKPEEFLVLNEGEQQRGNQALISAGTGLGEAGLYFDGSDHLPFACEGGHADFAPRNEKEIALFQFLQKRFGHVSYERVLSGPGMKNIYDFLVETGREKRDPEVEGETPKRFISDRAMNGESRACEHALDLFISLYGAEAGNTALKFMSLGGIFVGGGIAPKIASKMRDHFMKAFVDKGRFAEILLSIPVKILLNEETALLGAHQFAKKLS